MTPGMTGRFLSFEGIDGSGKSTQARLLAENLRAHGLTVSAFCSVSLDPPLILVCVDRNASMLNLLQSAEFFTVNILSREQESISRRFSVEEMELRFDGIGFSLGAFGTPALHDALAIIECRRVAFHRAGDHVIFIGEVVAGTVSEVARPLVYYAGEYGRVEP